MADRDHNRHAVQGSALALLALGLVLFYGWAWFPPRLQAQAWNAAGAIARLALLAALIWRVRLPRLRISGFTIGEFRRIRARWPRLLAKLPPLRFEIAARPLLLVALWWAAEDLMVAGCSIAFMISPWVVPKGHAQCSALMQFDIGQIGLAVVGLLLLVHPANSCSYER